MANIILTTACNLNCPYCFASEEMALHGATHISPEQFEKTVDFLLQSGVNSVGLIGGEPLLHPQLSLLLTNLLEKLQNGKAHAVLYTNGVYLQPHLKLLSHPKFKMLVNVNSAEDIGDKAHALFLQNLTEIYQEYHMGYKVTLGLNLYRPDQDVSHYFSLLARFGVKHGRIAVCIPKERPVGSLDFFKPYLPLVKSVLKKAKEENVTLGFDCNLIPYCLIDGELHALMCEMEQKGGRKYLTGNGESTCTPVLDFSPDGTVIRCFALSQTERVKMDDFASVAQILVRFYQSIDERVKNNPLPECADCKYAKSGCCTGGCMGFRGDLWQP